jgi:hypothetical protein
LKFVPELAVAQRFAGATKPCVKNFIGEMAEWPKAPVLKTGELVRVP